MNLRELREKWLLEEQFSFKGWDFSHLAGRWQEEQLPWDYKQLVLAHLKPEHQLLDMGTGGGEFLLTFDHPYENTTVTEAWEPNVKLCKAKLEPMGIRVEQVFDDSHLPFKESSFDMIINRHEAYDIKEVKRILKPNGLFITQQVGGENNKLLSDFLIEDFEPKFPDLCLAHEINKLRDERFNILFKQEYFPSLRFFDVGAIVYFVKIIEWEFPGFSVEQHYSKLCELHSRLLEEGYIETFEHRFIMAATLA